MCQSADRDFSMEQFHCRYSAAHPAECSDESDPIIHSRCELCGAGAYVFCEADEASLCSSCDRKVHTANFLVSRHVRTLLCSFCHCETSIRTVGARPDFTKAVCESCSIEWSEMSLRDFRSGVAPLKEEKPNADGKLNPASLRQRTVDVKKLQGWAAEQVVIIRTAIDYPSIHSPESSGSSSICVQSSASTSNDGSDTQSEYSSPVKIRRTNDSMAIGEDVYMN